MKWNNQGFSSHPRQKCWVTLTCSNSINHRRCACTVIHSANSYWMLTFLRLSRITVYSSKQLYLTPWGWKTHTVNSTTEVRIIWWITFKWTFIYFKSTALRTFFLSSSGVIYLGNPHAGRQWARALVFSLGVGLSCQGETTKPSKLLKWEAQMTHILPVLTCCPGCMWNLTNVSWAPTTCQFRYQRQRTHS